MKLLPLILILSISTYAQTPNNDALFGTFNVRNDAARIRLATHGGQTPIVFSSMGFDWDNGPPGEEFYKNHTWGLGYNADFNGAKIIPGVVSYMFSNESKFRNPPGGFMTEFHYNWSSPDGLINVRPFGWTVDYETGKFGMTIHGEINFFRHFSNGGGQWGKWTDDGFLNLTMGNGGIAFKNNHRALLWANSAGTNSVAPIYVDNLDRVILGGGQQETVINSAKVTYRNPQCGSIPDSNGTALDNARAINQLLACMRGNGMVPQQGILQCGGSIPKAKTRN